jgi:hypothetical protein
LIGCSTQRQICTLDKNNEVGNGWVSAEINDVNARGQAGSAESASFLAEHGAFERWSDVLKINAMEKEYKKGLTDSKKYS